MAAYYLAVLLMRIVLPAGILLSIAIRPFGISLIYLILYLLTPLAQLPNAKTFSGWRGQILMFILVISSLLLLSHAVFHATLAAIAPYGSLLDNYPLVKNITCNLGYVSYAQIAPLVAVHYVAPELVMCFTSLVVYIAVRKLLVNTGPDELINKESKHQKYPSLTSAGKLHVTDSFYRQTYLIDPLRNVLLRKYICLFLLMFSGILQPSVTSGIYFLVFMGAATAWALGQPLNNGFAVVGRCLMAIMAVHVILLIVYQCTWLIEQYPPDKEFSRYFGLTRLVTINVTSDSGFSYKVTDDHEWTVIVSPLVILITYFVLTIETRELFKPKTRKKSALTGVEEGKANGLVARVSLRRSRRAPRDHWRAATTKMRAAYKYIDSKAHRGSQRETLPLIRSVSPSKRTTALSMRRVSRPLHQDSIGSVVMPDNESNIEPEEHTLLDDVVAAIIDFFQILIRSSYIATTITMMAWSIMFHSWLAFVFLMWANIVWLCQNQRSFMLKTSPVLVVYAMLLLLLQYIYGMNLTEQELPSNVTIPDVNLRQIGISRPEGAACVPLLIKSLFTCMFWVTLRQRVQDIRSRRQSVLLTEMAAPLQLTVSTAAPAIDSNREELVKSRLMRALGEKLRAACARYWIYVVAIMLFVIGITGERMTIFRIFYMFLFLGFILMFQISWYWWRRLMYIFWITVIIYSMINLILIYVYQFDNFSDIIEKYLFNKTLQHDLGLDKYKPADLFVKLLTPTLFLIMTIMQVHYFHKDFMALSDPKTKTNSVENEPGSSRPSQGGASTMKDDLPALPLEGDQESALATEQKSEKEVTEVDQSMEMSTPAATNKKALGRNISHRQSTITSPSSRTHFRVWAWQALLSLRSRLWRWTDKMFLTLDVHLTKIIFVALMLLCVLNVCAMHVPIMVIICIAMLTNSAKQRFLVLVVSILISVYFMAEMVYQINYIRHNFFDVNCTMMNENNTNLTTYNNAEWVGFVKMTRDKPLVKLLKGYIGLIVLFTFYSLVRYRQETVSKDEPMLRNKEKLMFPEVTRKDADKDLLHCTKYLLNYGFYKFGVEITLICLVGVIGSRMDLYAVLYSAWLLLLVSSKRVRQARVWPSFTVYTMVLIPLQYMFAVGFLPQFCINYPWSGDDEQTKHFRTWFFLPYADSPPHATKLIFDFFLLLFASRQLHVFRIEKKYGDRYIGGSNAEDIGADWETPNFVNPVPDFLLTVGNWLDVVKRLVFLGMLWVTLAIMFLTGTNRVNLFSLGYLVGSFIFLWQGTDFYLRPKESILQWWSWLLRYNVCVVVVKALLQIPGCLFSEVMQTNACWLVQLLGIGCVDKFAGGNIAKFLMMDRSNENSTCSVPQEDIGLAWDGVCFAFLILQRRLFYSYYFYRVIDESKATTVLASRGAELIEELRQKQMRLQEEQEIKILEKIKIKMERIKANQKKIETAVKDLHHDAEEDEEGFEGEESDSGEEQAEQAEQVPLVRGDSEESRRGYHTPESPASPRGFHTPLSEPSAPPSPVHPRPLPALPPPASSQGGPPSPSSALMTVSLDAYLEPRRISFESPPSSELAARARSPEESYPVFSPPPIRRRHTLASPSLLQRTSVISCSSRTEPRSHHTSRGTSLYRPPATHQQAVRSGDYYMFDEFDDTELPLKDEESSEDEDAPKEMGFGKLLSTAFKSDLRHAVRRASAPNVPGRRHSPLSYTQTRSRPESDVNMTISKHEEVGSELDEYAPSPDEETKFETFKRYLNTVMTFVSSIIISITRFLLKYSRDYRYVSRTLTLEKKILKEKEGFGIGIREGSQMIWEPLPEALVQHQKEMEEVYKQLLAPVDFSRKLSELSVPEIRILAASVERGLDESPSRDLGRHRHRDDAASDSATDSDDTSEHESAFSLQTTDSKEITPLEEQDDSIFKQKAPIVRLGLALWYAILAHTDIACYVMVFVNQIQSAAILSIPLPLMVFLWGTLSIPRPTKTFWVTLIAYTEVIVLIKSMFQFDILPWNKNVVPANLPFTAPRIIGIERKLNYALYDLLLLLIIFLHRFMLKSLGLWKESTPEVELREDTEYRLSGDDTQLIVEGRGAEVGRKYVMLHDRSGPLHRLVDRLYHVQECIAAAMRDLNAPRHDPRVTRLVWARLQRLREGPIGAATNDQLREFVTRTSLGRNDEEAQEDHRRSHSSKDQYNSDAQAEELREFDLQPGPSKPPDDDHFQVDDDQEPIIAVKTTMENSYKYYPNVIVLSLKRYLRPTKRFFKRMLEPGARVTADVYAYMFMCDFFNFLVVIFGFAAFGTQQGDGGVQAYLEENKVPIPFLVMLILQFVLIVADRALYLRKFMLGKILFQYTLIIGVHVWMFFILPFITERAFNALLPPPMWYMVKCLYLLLSAYQIRCGYPRRIIGNFVCKSYRFINMILFRGFMAVPFVFELRTLMDWIWTDTSMTLMDWLKMEDIFASVFLLKCSRYIEDEFPQPRGQKKTNASKYMLGGSVLVFVIAIIWFPLVFFAFGNSVGQSNPPTDVTVKIRIGPFLPIYQMSAQSHNIDTFSEQDYTQLSNLYSRDRTAQTFLANYIYNDVAVVTINPNSTMTWDISPPELERLHNEAKSNSTLKIKFSAIVTHTTNSAQNQPSIDFNREIELPASSTAEREKLVLMLNGSAPLDTWLGVKVLFPKFVKVFNKGLVKPANQLMSNTLEGDASFYRDVLLRLERANGSMYWRVRESCEAQDKLSQIPKNNCDMLVMYTFNDKLFPETLNFISASGIIGLYTTFVFLASRVLRGFFSGIYNKIMFDDLPNVDRVLQLCLDIYLVREAVELSLEEDLFAKLVFLYRSPETMIKWTRPKEENPEQQRALPPSR